jgi:hypothetical protein
LFEGLTEDRIKSIDWLRPNYANPDGTIRLSIHAYVIESQGRRIIVDTCFGNDKPRNIQSWNMMKTPFLERLARPDLRRSKWISSCALVFILITLDEIHAGMA